MVSNNFETKIKETLEERRIEPSVNAWEKLQTDLDATKPKRGLKSFWVVGIAASVIGVMLISTWMFYSEPTSQTPPVIVEQPAEIPQEQETDSKPIHTLVTDSKIDEFKQEEHSLEEQKGKSTEKSHLIKNAGGIAKKPSTSVLVNTETKEKPSNTNEGMVEETLQNGLAEHTVTGDYIEDLLLQAEQDLAKKPSERIQQTVDSKQLLEHVENEIEHSFREKVFDAVKSGFVKVKTAVVERNH
ncbi:hypothetical protein [Formosa haliotis]|uniref:hypothetical protein n=1 Tax=Formosa haliotis TaxID=1555194 RepID=UPI00082478C3|nr:hypothetical protein [Formosa haliotis]